MKTIRNLMTLVGLFVTFLTLGTAGAKGQILDTPSFTGTFTLPFEAQWGKMTLPAGDYTLKFGLLSAGHALVEVQGKAEGSLHGVIRVEWTRQSSATKNELVCVREGDTLIVRALNMPPLRESVNFAMPRGAQRTANNGKHNGYTELAEAPMLIQQIPVTLNAK
jgi:hypothetical protein